MLLKTLWPYALASLLAVGVYFYVDYKWHESMTEQYNKGVVDGKKAVADNYAEKSIAQQKQWAIDKEKLEHDAQTRIEAAKNDAANARNNADSLYKQLNKVRSIAGQAGVAVTSSTSARQAVDLLADLFEQSNNRANTYAGFADSAYEAGRTCEVQYDKLRSSINAEQSSN